MGRETKEHLIHCGRVITAEELADIRETVANCTGLSRSERALAISESLEWRSASGFVKVDASVKYVEKLEARGVVRLPEKQASSMGLRKQLPLTNRTDRSEERRVGTEG